MVFTIERQNQIQFNSVTECMKRRSQALNREGPRAVSAECGASDQEQENGKDKRQLLDDSSDI